MNKFGKAALAAGLTAMVATTPLPAMAAYGSREVAAQRQEASPFDDASDYHRRRWRNRRLDVDAGDVILGIGLIAAIAAVADAGNKNRRSEPRNEDEPRYRDYDPTPAPSYNGGDDVGSAVTACTEAAERTSNGRVDEIGMDAAFGLVPALPAARARVFARFATLLVQGEQPIEG
jgi:hypothetical protein